MIRQSIKQLTELEHAFRCSKTQMRPDYVPKTKFEDRTANGLTKCVIAWINLNGGQAERISSTGRYIDDSKIVTDVLGNRKKIGTGKYIPGNGTKGTADISATIYGRSVKIEIKINDKQSDVQKKYQESIEKAGGIYAIVRNFDEFMELYNELTKQFKPF